MPRKISISRVDVGNFLHRLPKSTSVSGSQKWPSITTTRPHALPHGICHLAAFKTPGCSCLRHASICMAAEPPVVRGGGPTSLKPGLGP